jgi:hypothetical protein
MELLCFRRNRCRNRQNRYPSLDSCDSDSLYSADRNPRGSTFNIPHREHNFHESEKFFALAVQKAAAKLVEAVQIRAGHPSGVKTPTHSVSLIGTDKSVPFQNNGNG